MLCEVHLWHLRVRRREQHTHTHSHRVWERERGMQTEFYQTETHNSIPRPWFLLCARVLELFFDSHPNNGSRFSQFGNHSRFDCIQCVRALATSCLEKLGEKKKEVIIVQFGMWMRARRKRKSKSCRKHIERVMQANSVQSTNVQFFHIL